MLPYRRELLADGQPVKLGGRAFDVLMELIEARGAVISKDALMAPYGPTASSRKIIFRLRFQRCSARIAT